MPASSRDTVEHILLDVLIPPLMPSLARKSSEKFQPRSWRNESLEEFVFTASQKPNEAHVAKHL